jgi:hypothetical protein
LIFNFSGTFNAPGFLNSAGRRRVFADAFRVVLHGGVAGPSSLARAHNRYG